MSSNTYSRSTPPRRPSTLFWRSFGSPPINFTSPPASESGYSDTRSLQFSAPRNHQSGVSSESSNPTSVANPQETQSDLPLATSASSSALDNEIRLSPAAEFFSNLVDLPDSPDWNYPIEDYIDLTEEASPPDMPMPVSARATSARATSARSTESDRTHSTARATGGYGSDEGGSSTSQARPSKRRKVLRGPSPELKTEIEEIDLIDVDDDTKLSNALQEEAIRSQQAAAEKPAKLSDLQCIICLEKLTDMTITKCGMY